MNSVNKSNVNNVVEVIGVEDHHRVILSRHLKSQMVANDNIHHHVKAGDKAVGTKQDLEMTVIAINLLAVCKTIEMIEIVLVALEMKEIGEEETVKWREEVEKWKEEVAKWKEEVEKWISKGNNSNDQ